jgi:parvulin-like peptidyl-prolyl isomerase
VFRIPKTFSLISVLALSLLAVSCGDNKTTANGEAVAKVGSKEITIKQVDSAIKRQLAGSGSSSNLSPAEIVAARLTVLDKLIQEEAMYQKAQKESLVPDDNKVNQEVARQKQEAGLTEEQYQEQLKQAGMTEQEWKDQVRRSLAINELTEKEKARVTAPTDAEIEKYYNENRAQFVAQRGVNLSIIVTDPANNGAVDDAKTDAEAENKIKAIYEQLRGGADFATIASQRSEDASAVRSGNLGFASEDQLKQTFPTRPELVQRFMTMSAGQYTEPVKDNLSNRWYIFKVNAKRESATNLTLNDVRKDIVDAITRQRQEILLNALVLVAVADASVKNILAERIVKDPKTIVELRPSELLESTQTQPQQRIENSNSSTTPAPANSNSNDGKATSNANR